MKRYALKNIYYFTGKKGLLWLSNGIVANLSLGFIEYITALYIQFFMVSIGIIEKSAAPTILTKYLDLNIQTACFLLIGIGIFRAVAAFLGQQSTMVFSQIVNTRLRLLAIYDLLGSGRTAPLNASSIHHQFGEVFPKSGQFVHGLANSFTSSLQCLVLVILMGMEAFNETLVGVSGVVIIGLVVRFFQKKVVSISQGILSEQEKIAKGIERVTKNWFFLKICKTEKSEYLLLKDQALNYFNHLARSGFWGQLSGVFPPFFGVIFLSFIVYLSQTVFETSGPPLMAFLYLFIRFVQKLSDVAGTLSVSFIVSPQFREGFDYLISFPHSTLESTLEDEKHMHVLTEKKEKQRLSHLAPGLVKESNRSAPKLNVKGVSYGWGDKARPLFQDLNFEVPAGSIFGLKGKSGAGKSSLLGLVLGIYKPQGGEVLIDGISAHEYLSEKFYSIGYVGPSPYLIEGSIRDNLTYGQNRKFEDEMYIKALQATGLWGEVGQLNGLDTFISEAELGLSTGQKQRLSFARAYLREPSLLILDEATANLDHENELRISDIIESFRTKTTIILVSHRDDFLKIADKVLELKCEGQ